MGKWHRPDVGVTLRGRWPDVTSPIDARNGTRRPKLRREVKRDRGDRTSVNGPQIRCSTLEIGKLDHLFYACATKAFSTPLFGNLGSLRLGKLNVPVRTRQNSQRTSKRCAIANYFLEPRRSSELVFRRYPEWGSTHIFATYVRGSQVLRRRTRLGLKDKTEVNCAFHFLLVLLLQSSSIAVPQFSSHQSHRLFYFAQVPPYI